MPSQVPGKKLISKENEAENQREMSRSAPSAARRPYVILAIGAGVLVVVFLFYFLITRGNPPRDVLFFDGARAAVAPVFPVYPRLQPRRFRITRTPAAEAGATPQAAIALVFAEFSFTCVIDLVSALEYDGIISGFMDFYQKTGEPYLGTAYAIMMCYWDGIAHFIMYLVMISRITDRKAYRTLGLFWAGSLCANMSVFIAGIVTGKYGTEIRPAFWLNFVFLLFPVWGAVALFTKPKDRPLIGGYNAQHIQTMKLIWRPLDMILLLLLLAAMAFTVLRGLVAMDSPLEACGVYLQHYEPYLKDPVGFPRVMLLSEDRPPQERIIRRAASSRAPMMNFQPQPFGADDPGTGAILLYLVLSVHASVDRLSKDLVVAAAQAQNHPLIGPINHVMLHLFFYGLPLLGAFVYGLLKPGCTWMPDWTVFFAGAVIQCQWAHIGGFLHPRTAAPFRIPSDVFWPVLAANLLYGVTPLLVALRVYSNHYFFLKIAPFPGQTGLPNSEEKDTKYKDK
ncbi:Transmembrane 6 superfamily member 1 [Takifugu flavidus]|uniref:Transmembrane 6 superfamily member 1 n=1 Tax=Takifugu flavidus TaxID=433684 RepID=A0A5C6MWE4_9TELE|nr:Transmembrane 6 superfamily member 1 [Takifugu flavidus]